MINWGITQGGNSFQNALSQGFQIGSVIRQRNQQEKAAEAEAQGRNALAGYAMGDESQMADAMRYNPQATIGIRGDMKSQQAAAQEQRRADLPFAISLLEGATDEASYRQNMQVAQQYGIDTSSFPQQFDPAWREQNLATMKLLASPKGQEILSTAGKVAADMGLEPGTPEFATYVRDYTTAQMAKPYTGSQGETRLYTPQIGGDGQTQGGINGPQPGTVEDGYRFKGGDPSDQSNWEQVGGGATNSVGGFPAN